MPNLGGVLDQDPDLMSDFSIIMGQIAKAEKSKARQQEMEAKRRYPGRH